MIKTKEFLSGYRMCFDAIFLNTGWRWRIADGKMEKMCIYLKGFAFLSWDCLDIILSFCSEKLRVFRFSDNKKMLFPGSNFIFAIIWRYVLWKVSWKPVVYVWLFLNIITYIRLTSSLHFYWITYNFNAYIFPRKIWIFLNLTRLTTRALA